MIVKLAAPAQKSTGTFCRFADSSRTKQPKRTLSQPLVSSLCQMFAWVSLLSNACLDCTSVEMTLEPAPLYLWKRTIDEACW
jgi:hypothetical protein